MLTKISSAAEHGHDIPQPAEPSQVARVRLVIERPGQQEHARAAQPVVEHLQHRAVERDPRVVPVGLAQLRGVDLVHLRLGRLGALDTGHIAPSGPHLLFCSAQTVPYISAATASPSTTKPMWFTEE